MSLDGYNEESFREKINVFTGVNFSWINAALPGDLNKDIRSLRDRFSDSSVGLFASSNGGHRFLGSRSRCMPEVDSRNGSTTTVKAFIETLAPNRDGDQ